MPITLTKLKKGTPTMPVSPTIGPTVQLFNGDCLNVLPKLERNSVDAIVTDPPYGLEFMGKEWDHGVPGTPFWSAMLDVVKPGAFLLAFGGTRTFHRLACAIEDSGWEIRDTVMWVYGSGFPKSHNVANSIDKLKGCGPRGHAICTAGTIQVSTGKRLPPGELLPAYEARTPEGQAWQGWGTALKPAWEPIIVARKPLMGTVAQNVLKYGVGGLNIDESRVGDEVLVNACAGNKKGGNSLMMSVTGMPDAPSRTVVGRWPANLIHDGSPDVLSCFPKDEHRFFYTAKASKSDRGTDNTHPTVKPTALMEYLCKLVGPPGCTILDPMMGSGSTGVAAKTLGYNFVGIEMHPPYFQIAERRISEARHAFV